MANAPAIAAYRAAVCAQAEYQPAGAVVNDDARGDRYILHCLSCGRHHSAGGDGERANQKTLSHRTSPLSVTRARSGSKADMCSAPMHVRFVPIAEFWGPRLKCPLRASAGYSRNNLLGNRERPPWGGVSEIRTQAF